MSNATRIVAKNLARLRLERELSLSELSRLSGVGKATLSGLEAGGGNPTIETLWTLADALGVAFGELVSAPEPQPSVQVKRAAEGIQVPAKSAGARLIERFSGRNVVELYEMRLEAEGIREANPHPVGVMERVLVNEGAILVGPLGEAVELGVGDFVRFPGDVPHRYEALGGKVRVMVMLEYPAVNYPKEFHEEDLRQLVPDNTRAPSET